MNTRRGTIPDWPLIEEDEIQAASRALRSGKVNYWTGEEGKRFEEEYASYTGKRYGICISNGTLTMELALRAFGVGPGDEVIVAPRTFVATASAVMFIGAKPVFCDVDRYSGNISAKTIAPAITPRTKAIIVVHLAGWPCDMDPIMELANRYQIRVIEDCAQAHGARYKGRPVGALGHIGSFSFCQDKIITTGGEGGLLTMDDPSLWNSLWSLKEHGKSYNTVYHKQHPPGFRWLHEEIGTNGRMTEMQAAIGRVALRKLDHRVATRRRNAKLYDEQLAACPALEILQPAPEYYHSYYRYYLNVRPERLKAGWSRDRITQIAFEQKTPVTVGACCEIYREAVFERRGLAPESRFPNAKWLSENALFLPVYSTLEEEHVLGIAEDLLEIMEQATN